MGIGLPSRHIRKRQLLKSGCSRFLFFNQFLCLQRMFYVNDSCFLLPWNTVKRGDSASLSREGDSSLRTTLSSRVTGVWGSDYILVSRRTSHVAFLVQQFQAGNAGSCRWTLLGCGWGGSQPQVVQGSALRLTVASSQVLHQALVGAIQSDGRAIAPTLER